MYKNAQVGASQALGSTEY